MTGRLHRPADVGSLAEALLEVVADADRNVAMGVAARQAVRARVDPGRVAGRLVAGYRAAIAGQACVPV